jgi:hypothetical protein
MGKILALVALVAITGCGDMAGRPIPDASQAKTWLVSQIPLGASKTQVIAFLKSHKFEDHYTMESDYAFHVFPEPGSSDAVHCDLLLLIGFNERNKVTSRKASQYCTGP